MRPIVLVLATLLVGACGILGPDDVTLRRLEVAPFKRSCFGVFRTLCLQVRDPGETNYRNMLDPPEGFDFEWGVAYLIEVEERERSPVPADASSIQRTLRRVLSRMPEPPGATFELFVAPGGLEPLEEGFAVYRLEEVSCGDGTACAGLAEEVGGDDWIRLVLTYPPAPGAAFGLEGWAVCEGPTGPCVEPGPAGA